jgi:tetratricopeptide (TPR) repeat protein
MPPPREHALPAATKIFVDRDAPQTVFEKAVHSIPANGPKLLVFYGVGGQGKTALCRELIRKTAPTAEPSYAFLRRAELDLHKHRTDDPDLLMVWIRNSFAEGGIDLPIFDMALALAWEATRGEQPFPNLSRPWLRRSTATAREVGGAAADWLFSDKGAEFIGDAVGEIPGMGFLVKLIGGWAFDKAKKAYLLHTRDTLKELYSDGELKKPHELSDMLPRMLAHDLNYHLSKRPTDRFVLFIDEYERVFNEGGGRRWNDNPFDNHVRKLIQHTDGLLAVFFSRERLPWESDPDWRDDLKDQQHLLGGLSEVDAHDFLQKIPIGAPDIRKAIVDSSKEELRPDAPIYPLMLDLQVEHWRTLLAKNQQPEPHQFQVTSPTFEARRREIVARVLREHGLPMQMTIERLSVARRFDREAFAHVVRTFGTGLPLDCFDQIAGLSFVTGGDDGFLAIHNVVAQTIRETLDPERRRTSIEALLDHYSARATVKSPREVTDATVAALVEAVALRQAKGIDGYVAWLETQLEQTRLAARYASMEQMWRGALEAIETSLGPEHPDTAASLDNLAGLLQAQGDLAGARLLYERALAIRETVLGPEHLDTARSLYNQAGLLHIQGDLAGARRFSERALAIREKVLGPEHPDTARSLNNFALLLHAQSDLTAARPLFERALAIYEKALGPENVATATSLRNLADLLRAQGDLIGARPLLERALAIYEKVLGPEHPATAGSLDMLAMVLKAQGDLAGARPRVERALAIHEKALGSEHPDTAASLNNLALLLKAQGDLAGARPLFERALAISEKALGPEHPHTASSLRQLASVLKAQGDLTAGRILLERALAIDEKVLGPEHPETARSLNNLAALLDAQGDLAGARPLFERALAIQEKVLGPEHRSTATVRRNLAELSARGA